jgi:hypothetical protein
MRISLMLSALLTGSMIFVVQQAGTFSPLYTMAGGTWQMKTKKGYICERWKKLSATEMQSQGFKVTGKDTVTEEQVKIVQRGDGIYYIPTVNGQNGGKEVPFKLASSINKEYIFANPSHDFPQRVGYHLVSQDSVHAWIDGQYNGKYVKQDFYYKRVK